jgi:four helix bundle protein
MNRLMDRKKKIKEKDFTNLKVWQEAHRLMIVIYKLSSKFPKQELYGITSQIRRAAVSVELNIAEGYGRYHVAEDVKFLLNARGSIAEVQSSLLIAKDLKFVKPSNIAPIYHDYRILTKRINSLIRYKRNMKKN